MGALEPTCWKANAHRVSRGADWDAHGIGYYSPALGGPLSAAGGVNSADYNSQRGELAIASGAIVDLTSPLGVIRTISPNLGGIAETVTKVSYAGPYLYCASANDSKIINIPTGQEIAIGTTGVVDAVIGSTIEDSNSNWNTEVTGTVNFPDDFLIEVTASNYKLISVPDLTTAHNRAFVETISSVDCREGVAEVGTDGGRYSLQYVPDKTVLTTTAGSSEADTVDGVPAVPTTGPAIANDGVNAVSVRVINGTTEKQEGKGTNGAKFVEMDGAIGTNVSTPFNALNSTFNTGITIVMRVAPDAWSGIGNKTYAGKIKDTNNRAAFAEILNSGVYQITTSPDGSSGNQVAGVCTQNPDTVFSAGELGWITAGLLFNVGGNRVYDFFYSKSTSTTPPAYSDPSWTRLGVQVVTAGTTSIVNNDSPWEMGSGFLGTSQRFQGDYYYLQVYDGDYFSGSATLVSNADPNDYVTGGTWTDSQLGDVWTLGGTANVQESTVPVDVGMFVPTRLFSTATLPSFERSDGNIYDVTGLTGTDYGVLNTLGHAAFYDTTGTTVYTNDVPTADTALAAWKYGEYSGSTVPNLIGSAVQDIAYFGPSDTFFVADAAGGTFVNENIPPRPALIRTWNEPPVRVYTDDFNRDTAIPWAPTSANTTATIVNQELNVTSTQAAPQNVSVGNIITLQGAGHYTAKCDFIAGDDVGQILVPGDKNSPNTSPGSTAEVTNYLTAATQDYRLFATNATQNTPQVWDNFTLDLEVSLTGIVPKSFSTSLKPVSGELEVSGESLAYGTEAVDTVAGVEYTATCPARVGTSANATINIGTTPGAFDIGTDTTTSNATLSVVFTAASSVAYFSWSNGADTGTALFGDTTVIPNQPVATPVDHISDTYQTGYGKQWDGAWANDTSAASIPALSPLPDNSGLSNDLTINGGTALRNPFGNSGLFSVLLTDVITASGTVTTGGQLIGWEFDKDAGEAGQWLFRRDISEFVNATEVAGTLTIGGDADGTDVALLRWNKQPMDLERLIQLEAEEAGMADVEPKGSTC